jgi:dipeptidase D
MTDSRASVPDALRGVEPARFWEHFERLTTIPRPSRHEEPVIEHVRSWAAEHGFELQQDAGRNLVIRVPATGGREAAPTLILQGHLDMVCERDPSSPNDPAEGRIALRRDGDWLTADGTTLGADDGVAIAAMMALVEDASLPHGPLELLMTVAEEVGLEGANALDGSMLTGSILLNLDSEEDGRLTVGCAGSTDTWIRIDAPRAPAADGATPLTVTVSGGQGGHSGSGIHLGRSNAIKVLGRALREAHAAVPFRLVSLDGGKSRNAIPRDAVAVVSVAADRTDAFRDAIGKANETIRDAFAKTDAGVTVVVGPADASTDTWSEETTERLLDAIALVPTGLRDRKPEKVGTSRSSPRACGSSGTRD